MAKRDRVPRHKSHQHKRNKNPKLSPYQREQKRDRLANQAPTQKEVERPYASGQKKLYEYFQAREARDAEKREARRLLREEKKKVAESEAPAAVTAATRPTPSAVASKAEDGSRRRPRSPSASSTIIEEDSTGRKKKYPRVEIASLNTEFKDKIVGSTSIVVTDPTREIIQRKKAKKHEKKLEQRKERAKERQKKAESDLQDMLRSANESASSKRKRKQASAEDAVRERDRAYEKELRVMQAKRALEEAEASAAKLKEEEAAEKEAAKAAAAARKRIQFDEANVGAATDDLAHRAMRFPGDVRVAGETATAVSQRPKAKDFDQFVDIVRFGERVEAPPVLDVIPDKKSSVSKLALKLQQEDVQAEVERKRRHQQMMREMMAKKEASKYSYNSLVGSAPSAAGGKVGQSAVPIGAGLSSDGLPLRPSEGGASSSTSSSGVSKKKLTAASSTEQRYALLSGNSSGSSNPTGLAERKRLASLGLAPRVTEETVSRDDRQSDATQKKNGAKVNEFELLRQRVMECYQRGKSQRHDQKKAVDLKHSFPAI